MKKSASVIIILCCIQLLFGCVSNSKYTEMEAKLQECNELAEAQRDAAEEARQIAEEQRQIAVLTADSLAAMLKEYQEGN